MKKLLAAIFALAWSGGASAQPCTPPASELVFDDAAIMLDGAAATATGTLCATLDQQQPPSTNFSDDFTVSANQPLQDRDGWAKLAGTNNILAVAATGDARGAATAIDTIVYSAAEIGPDVSVSVTLTSTTGNSSVAWHLLARGEDAGTFYALAIKRSSLRLFLSESGSVTQLGLYQPGVIPAGTDIRLEVVGTALSVYYNDAEVLAATNSALASGWVGLGAGGLWIAGDRIDANMALDDYHAAEPVE